jgi:hypothetical protein
MLPPKQQRQKSDGRASADGASCPNRGSVKPPETQWDFDERQDTRATRDNGSLKRNIQSQWHRTAQRLVTYAGITSLTLAVIFLTRKLGLPPQTAAKLHERLSGWREIRAASAVGAGRAGRAKRHFSTSAPFRRGTATPGTIVKTSCRWWRCRGRRRRRRGQRPGPWPRRGRDGPG